MPNLEQKLAKLQINKAVSASDIAAHLGVDDSVITRLKKSNNLQSKHLPAIADYLDTTVEYLTDGQYKDRYRASVSRSKLSRRIDALISDDTLSLKDQGLILSFVNELAKKIE